MRRFHMPALVLIGWYLMAPHLVVPEGPQAFYIVRDAPLSRWDIDQSFDHADDCEKARKRYEESTAKSDYPIVVSSNMSKLDVLASRLAIHDRALNALCIASDDPRLKER